jgi:hypothetical protein
MRTLPPVVALVAVAAAIVGCDGAKSLAARAGISGFEARCEATLPVTRIEVVNAPVVYGTDRTRTWRELVALGGDATPGLRPLGLTTAKISHNASVETAGIEEQRSGRVCVRPSIRVELSTTPMMVYIDREIAADGCRDAAALEHELKHVAVYEDEMAKIAEDVRAQLESSYGNRILYYASRVEAQREVKAALGAEVGPLLAADARRIKDRQREVDTPEEYARVSAMCGGMVKE